ncbi:uncharacterized protein [Nerophis lumbriciformis]|uniref:uncharacterized protein n=1 Tax=Nerophis lumbriciformis TaxID=546530 RepID=UPI002ADF6D88|nr:uncharacterized protein LOC133572222 [Nerophis lumbriciformis]
MSAALRSLRPRRTDGHKSTGRLQQFQLVYLEHPTGEQANWEQVGAMIGYKISFHETLSHSQTRTGRGSPLCQQMRNGNNGGWMSHNKKIEKKKKLIDYGVVTDYKGGIAQIFRTHADPKYRSAGTRRVQYDVGPPFAAITSSTLLGRLSTRLQSGISKAHWSGLCAGQSSSSTPDSVIHVFIDFALCTGAQSRWKRKGTNPNCSRKLGTGTEKRRDLLLLPLDLRTTREGEKWKNTLLSYLPPPPPPSLSLTSPHVHCVSYLKSALDEREEKISPRIPKIQSWHTVLADNQKITNKEH